MPVRYLKFGVPTWLGVHLLAALVGVHGLALTNFLVLGTAAGVGVAIGRSLRSLGALVTLGVTASIVDIVSFSGGPTRWLLDTDSAVGESALRFLAVAVPLKDGKVPVVGLGDLLLLAVFYVALRSLGRGRLISGVVLCTGLLVALAVGLWRGGAFGIPFMAVGAVALAVPRKPASTEDRPDSDPTNTP